MAETLAEKVERITLENQQLMTELDENSDYSVGTVLYELVIKPASILQATQEDALEVDRANKSLLNVIGLINDGEEVDDASVDELLSNFNVTRRTGTRASGSITIYTNNTANVFIGQSTVLLTGNVELRPLKSYIGYLGTAPGTDNASVSHIPMREISPGTYVFNIEAETVDVFSGVIGVGEPVTLTPSQLQVSQAVVASTFLGGSQEESTTSLLERASVGIHARVLTGRDNIRSMLQDNVIIDVLDSQVFGMGDELMLRDKANTTGISGGGAVDAYVRVNPTPTTATVTLTGTYDSDTDLWTIEIPAEDYPGAYGVLGVNYADQLDITSWNTVLDYYTDENAPFMSEAIHARYSKYQLMSIQFSVYQSLDAEAAAGSAQFEVDIYYTPSLVALQDYVEDPNVRNYAFDTLIKGAVPVDIQIAFEVQYRQGVTPPDAAVIQAQVADIINGKLIGHKALQSSDIVYASKIIFPEGEVIMPINMWGKTYRPDGTTVYTHSQDHIEVAPVPGQTVDNSMFVCIPSDVNVILTEVIV
jgi:hypothetical protein